MKGKKFTEQEIEVIINDSIEAICGKDGIEASKTRIAELVNAAYHKGRGIHLPSGKVIRYCDVHAFVSSCYKASEESFDGPLDIMDRRIDKFIYDKLLKAGVISDHDILKKDSQFLENICYDMATLDL